MKYAIVILGLTILSLYAGLDNRIKKVSMLNDDIAWDKVISGMSSRSLNIMQDFRTGLKPPRILPYPFPMIIAEHDETTSYWGPRMNPLKVNTGGSEIKNHEAVDMTGIPGAQVLAVADGIVLHKWYEKGNHNGDWYDGNIIFNGYVVIVHDDGMISHYGHVSDILVHEGERVKKGQPIARISRQVDKYSTGPHLDFRLQDESGEYVNPLLWIGESE